MDKPKRYTVTPPPYIRSAENVRGMMCDVLIALTPALIMAVVIFGLRVLTLTAVSVATCVGCEWLWTTMRRRKTTVGDLSAVVTGVLLSFTLPASVPVWIPAVGAAFAIIVVKQLFGGLGKNLFNPALGGYVFLVLSWPDYMTRFVNPQLLRQFPLPVFATPVVVPESVMHSSDAAIAGSVTDWTHIASGTLFTWLQEGRKPFWSLWDLLTGVRAGALGETAVLALLAGCAYLIWRRVLKYRITAGFVLSVAVLSLLFPMGGYHYAGAYPATALFGGMLLLGAIFMATDTVTSPVTPGGQWVYGIGCGILTELIRHRGVYPDGVAFAILLMNVLTWTLDRYLRPTDHPRLDALRGRCLQSLAGLAQRAAVALQALKKAMEEKRAPEKAAVEPEKAEETAAENTPEEAEAESGNEAETECVDAENEAEEARED